MPSFWYTNPSSQTSGNVDMRSNKCLGLIDEGRMNESHSFLGFFSSNPNTEGPSRLEANISRSVAVILYRHPDLVLQE